MNGTFISSDGIDTKVRYRIGLRHRGQGSRGAQPPNYRVNLPSDNRWNGVTAFALNSRFTYSQLAGSLASRKAGVPSEEAGGGSIEGQWRELFCGWSADVWLLRSP
jgi:hypothetical protein